MSEWLYKENPHMNNLREYCKGMLEGGDVKSLYEEYEHDIQSVTPEEVMALVDWMVAASYELETIKSALNKIMNIFYNSLDTTFDENATTPPFIKILIDENQRFTEKLNAIKETLVRFSKADRQSDDFNPLRLKLKADIEALTEFDLHYIKKENILFPHVEKNIPEYGCLQVMWSIHDDIRKRIKELSNILGNEYLDPISFNRAIGKFYFDAFGIIFREDYILLPMAAQKIPEAELTEMALQCPEIGYAYIDAPDLSQLKAVEQVLPKGIVNLETGELSVEQLMMMLNTLPVDITFVDEHDCVRFFSSPKDRIFPRSKAIIGRNVQNCHPPESVHIVNEVVDRLKSGEKDVENFWIQMGGKFILIQYYALRDAEGAYKGTIEVSQDITEIKKLEGEKRLLDYT